MTALLLLSPFMEEKQKGREKQIHNRYSLQSNIFSSRVQLLLLRKWAMVCSLNQRERKQESDRGNQLVFSE